jgi:hypothetical protein
MIHARTELSSSTNALARQRGLERGPHLQPIVGLEPFQYEREVGRVKPAEAALQLDDVLTLLQLCGNAAVAPILAVGERHERAVMLQQRRDLVKRPV